jgi:hypothetical protein
MVSKQKAQLVSSSVTYLGLSNSPSHHSFPYKRIQNLLQISLPCTKRELLSILGLFNFFQIWIPNFSLVAQPLYKATKGSLHKPILTLSSLAPNLITLKKSFNQASPLHLTDPSKPFYLFIQSKQMNKMP